MKNKKGITLIELVAAVAITSILLVVISNALIANLKFFNKNTFENDSQLSSYDIYNNMKRILTQDGNKEITVTTLDKLPASTAYEGNHTYIYPKDGVLMVDEAINKDGLDGDGTVDDTKKYRVSMLDDEHHTINFTTIANNPNVVNVEITVDGGGLGDYTYENMIILRKNTVVVFPESSTDAPSGPVIIIEDVLPKVVVE